MIENNTRFDLILMNNASREFFLFSGLIDTSENHLYHKFENLDLGDLKDGEYTYCLLRNERDDVNYTFKVPILDTIVETSDDNILLKYLQPPTGLLRIGNVMVNNIYNKDEKKDYFYYDN